MEFSEKKYLIGVDMGGTKISAGLVKGSEVVKQSYRKMPGKNAASETVTGLLIEVIRSLFNEDVAGIGIGLPSLVDRERGVVYEVQNIPNWQNIPVKQILQKEFHVPVFLDNDANCFALGEYMFGEPDNNPKSFVGLTIGTGMGAGIINNGHLFPDKHCGSGEFGGIPYLDATLEDYCSGKFFQTFYKTTGEKLAGEAASGNPEAIDAFREFGKHLGNAIKTILFTVDPETIVIGGSVAKSAPFFEKSMWEEIRKFPYEKVTEDLTLRFAQNGQNAVRAAAWLYYDRQNTNKISN